MFSRLVSPFKTTLGLRLSWHFSLIMLGGLALFAIAYVLLSYALYHRDQAAIRSELLDYADEYHRGGVDAIKDKVVQSSRTGPLPFFVRVSGARGEFSHLPQQWDEEFQLELLTSVGNAAETWFDIPTKNSEDEEILEVAALRLADGTQLQVGQNSEGRLDILELVRNTFAMAMVLVIIAGLAVGALLALRALRPLHDLQLLVRSIVSTGTLNARAPVTGSGDELDKLSEVFNVMLDRIKLLMTGMRNALDNVAHDLRTPMTRLQGMAEGALRTEMPAEQLREALANCIEESNRILIMLNTLMDISEAETGTLKLATEPLNVRKLVEQVIDLYAYVAEDKDIEISTQVPQELTLCADRNRMLQLLANLVDNAIKYSLPGGQVEIAAILQAQQIVISITDTGIGIPSEDLARIWDRLYRGDKSGSQPGLGLGLSLVKAVVRAHNGSIEVASGQVQGSRFIVSLPV